MTYFSKLSTEAKRERVALVGFDGVTGLDLIGPLETFTRARAITDDERETPCYDVVIVSAGKRIFVSESGIVFQAHQTLPTVSNFDTIVIPGGSGIREHDTIKTIGEWLKNQAVHTRRIASVSTGTYLVAATGLLDQRQATTHWRFASDLARRFPKLRVTPAASFLKDGPFYTSGGGTAGMEMTLALIEEDFGVQVALDVARELVMRLRPAGHTESSIDLSQYQSGPAGRLADLPAWILANLNKNLSVETLAARTCVCPRHFNRLFKTVFESTPAEFVEQMRLNEARQLLLRSHHNVSSVAAAVGFTNIDTFRRAFERLVGVTPSSFRNRHKGAARKLHRKTAPANGAEH